MQNEQNNDAREKKRKTDRRTLYTRKVIMDSYIQLIKEKSQDKIRVSEICRLAEINRCTFYLHFSNISDVEFAIEQKILGKVKEFVSSQENSKKSRMELSYKFVEKMLQDDTYVTLLSTRQKDSMNSLILRDFFRDFVEISLSSGSHLSSREKELLYAFVSGGTVAVQQFWIESGAEDLREENTFLDQMVRAVMSARNK